MTIRLALGILLIIATGLAQANAAAGNAAAEQKIRAALTNWVEAANQGDAKGMLAVWAPDLVGWPADGPDDTYDREAAYAKGPAQPVTTTYALQVNEVIVDGALAVVRDTWTQTTKADAGPDKVAIFRSYEVWRRQPDGNWKISCWLDGPMKPVKN